ncbi:hypothetical protein KSP39_PZI023540 [Platanthera zijinensis]|uniref:Uncharacterized protein n=1 Tax=Platanthera zijinensis TaxID=2320716 RepID=A0AAP0AUG5_9ASPA
MRAQARRLASTVLCSFSSSNSDNKQYLCLAGVKTLIRVNLLRSTNSARPLPPFISTARGSLAAEVGVRPTSAMPLNKFNCI